MLSPQQVPTKPARFHYQKSSFTLFYHTHFLPTQNKHSTVFSGLLLKKVNDQMLLITNIIGC